jgi:hypothetical protein
MSLKQIYKNETNSEVIWSKLKEVATEPFLRRNIYNKLTDTFIDRYPKAQDTFTRKIIILMTCYLRSLNGKKTYLDIEKRIRKESKEWFHEIKVGDEVNKDTVFPISLMAIPLKNELKCCINLIDPFGAEIMSDDIVYIYCDNTMKALPKYLTYTPKENNRRLKRAGTLNIFDVEKFNKIRKN